MHKQLVDEKGNKFVLLPVKEYERLCRNMETSADIAVYNAAMARKEEGFPKRLFDKIDEGRSAVTVFREYRRMKQSELAKASGITEAYLSQIESGKRKGSAVLKKIAKALRVPMELICE